MALIFSPASCPTWVNHVRSITNINNFSKFLKIEQSSKKISLLRGDNTHFTKSFFKSLPADVFHLASKTYNWINFPSKIPAVEQLFCRTAHWVHLRLHKQKMRIKRDKPNFPFLKYKLRGRDESRWKSRCLDNATIFSRSVHHASFEAMFIVLQVLKRGSLNRLKRIPWLAWATYQALKMLYQSWQTSPALKAFQKQQLFYEETNFPLV